MQENVSIVVTSHKPATASRLAEQTARTEANRLTPLPKKEYPPCAYAFDYGYAERYARRALAGMGKAVVNRKQNKPIPKGLKGEDTPVLRDIGDIGDDAADIAQSAFLTWHRYKGALTTKQAVWDAVCKYRQDHRNDIHADPHEAENPLTRYATGKQTGKQLRSRDTRISYSPDELAQLAGEQDGAAATVVRFLLSGSRKKHAAEAAGINDMAVSRIVGTLQASLPIETDARDSLRLVALTNSLTVTQPVASPIGAKPDGFKAALRYVAPTGTGCRIPDTLPITRMPLQYEGLGI